jgi:hypothetical protein
MVARLLQEAIASAWGKLTRIANRVVVGFVPVHIRSDAR